MVVGSTTSSNSKRLRDIAQQEGVRAYLIDNADEIDMSWLQGVQCVGITAGASAPEHLVQEVVGYLKTQGADSVETLDGVVDRIGFPLPTGL